MKATRRARRGQGARPRYTALALVLAGLALTPPAAAGDDEPTPMFTNADLVRMSRDPEARRGGQLVIRRDRSEQAEPEASAEPGAPDDAARALAAKAARNGFDIPEIRTRLEARDHEREARDGGHHATARIELGEFDAPVESWQDEYYRLKALALRLAIERGDAIDFGDATPSAGGPPDQETPDLRYQAAGPTCVYAGSGRLIHSPDGIDCPESRPRHAVRSNASGAGQDTCLYGLAGEVLHQPRGKTCGLAAERKR